MQAIVLVGGEGTRLKPLTDAIPKPALTLVDRPLLVYMIEWLAGHGVDEVVLACGFLPQALREALAGEEERAGVSIRYLVEPEPLGTAGAIRFAADQLGEELDDRFLALNGDVLTDLDLSALLEAHAKRAARATIALHAVEDSSAYGLVRSDEEGEVLEFAEKTGEAVAGEVNAGMYVLERSVLDLIPPVGKISIERSIFPAMVGKKLRSLALDGYWMDIGTPQRYLQASWDILERRVRTRVEPTGEGLLVDASAEVDPGATVGPRAVVGPGCRLAAGAAVRDSVLLEGCSVGEGATVAGSILAPGATVEAGAELRDAVAAPGERLPG
ncbi:MAG: NDP-sugar synthase [Solirubrobacterales bacterium]